MKIHAIEPRSGANGPGTRFVIWFQGCSLGCPGCYNPNTHSGAAGDEIDVESLMLRLKAQDGAVQGITISGGEPFEQPAALLELVQNVRAQTALSILIFSGFTRSEIEAIAEGPAVLASIDVLIDGRYVAGQRVGTGLRGSANQRIQLLTDRYNLADVTTTPEAEIRIDGQGRVHLTGVDPLVLKD